MKRNRRDFLIKSSCALGMTALATQMRHFGLISALAQERAMEKADDGGQDGTAYRALVCVFLSGGNDGNNTVVPKHTAGYAQYQAARQAQGLAIPAANLLSINPMSLGLEFGLHPSMTDMQALFNQGKMAVVCNVGTLVQPLTRAQYQAGMPRPMQLFSHSNQVDQHRTAVSTFNATTGWGGRLADRTANQNPGAAISMVTSIAGANVFNIGNTSQPLIVTPAPTPLNQVLTLNGFGTAADELARRAALNSIRTHDLNYSMVSAASALTQQAVNVSQQLSNDPPLTVTFPNTTLGNQLRQVAKLMKFRTQLNMSRQIFYVQLGGFDTHSGQLNGQANLLTQVSQALKAFYDETVAQGIADDVTTFTLSDFNRTLNPAASGSNVGSDHAWGNHAFVLGGAVRGNDFYGLPTSNGSIFPSLLENTADDSSTRGRFIPTVSVEMYAATLARWFGLTENDIPLVFPNMSSFPTSNLGFML